MDSVIYFWGDPAMDSHPTWGSSNTLNCFMLQKPSKALAAWPSCSPQVNLPIQNGCLMSVLKSEINTNLFYAVKCNLTELTTKSASVVWSQRRFIHGHAPNPMCSSTEVCRSVLGH